MLAVGHAEPSAMRPCWLLSLHWCAPKKKAMPENTYFSYNRKNGEVWD